MLEKKDFSKNLKSSQNKIGKIVANKSSQDLLLSSVHYTKKEIIQAIKEAVTKCQGVKMWQFEPEFCSIPKYNNREIKLRKLTLLNIILKIFLNFPLIQI